jgi:hypothetical protein
MRALAEQFHELLVKMIDLLSELVDCHECVRRLVTSERKILPFQPAPGFVPPPRSR